MSVMIIMFSHTVRIAVRFYNINAKIIWTNGKGFFKIIDYIPGKLSAKIDNIENE